MRSSCLALAIVTAITASSTAIASKAVQDKESPTSPVPTLEATGKVPEMIREDEKAKSADADYLTERDNDPKHARDNAAKPVPEPSGWALLLAGACVIGLAATRKRPAPFQ